MIVRWQDGKLVADREGIAHLYGVSVMTVRRYCRAPVGRDPRNGALLFDAVAAEDDLEDVVPRADRTAAAARVRAAAGHIDPAGPGLPTSG